MTNLRKIICILAFTCTVLASAALEPSGTLPVMYISTEGNTPITSKEDYLQATYYLDPMGFEGIEAVGSAQAPEPLQIRGRGNWTWSGFDKKPYRIKLETKTPLMGCKKSKHFALLAHADDSFGFMRNAVGFQLSRMIGMPWTPADKPLEVVLNGDYIGLYFLTETIRVDKDRVNIVEQPDLNEDPATVSGGWLLEIDNYTNDPHITVPEYDKHVTVFTYKTPEILSPLQNDWLTTHMTAINNAIFSNDKDDCTWAEYVDLDILARYYIVQEIVDDYESFHGSCYLNRQLGDSEKWKFGPVWDFGSAFNHSKSQFIYQGREHHQTWIGEMCKFPEFMKVVRDVWSEFLAGSYTDIYDYIDAYASQIAGAARRDAERWPYYGNADELARASVVKNYLRKSVSWLSEEWGGEIPPTEKAVTVYFRDNGDTPWGIVNAFVWDNGYNPLGGWPGSYCTAIDLDGEPAWMITFEPENELSGNAGIIFNNGHSGVESGNQTIDLRLVNKGIYNRQGLIGVMTGISDGCIIPSVSDDDCISEISVRPGTLIVDTSDSCNLEIFTADGRRIMLNAHKGHNEFSMPRGIYIVRGRKFAL